LLACCVRSLSWREDGVVGGVAARDGDSAWGCNMGASGRVEPECCSRVHRLGSGLGSSPWLAGDAACYLAVSGRRRRERMAASRCAMDTKALGMGLKVGASGGVEPECGTRAHRLGFGL
jgi:hypothetical protein